MKQYSDDCHRRSVREIIMKTKKIVINHDSVCMGDDCMSHEKNLSINEDMTMIDLFEYLIEYVPSMNNVIWAVRSDKGVCGYIITDENGKAVIELIDENQFIMNTELHDIMCVYYYPSCFSWIDGETGEHVHKYSESLSFLEKVRKDNE